MKDDSSQPMATYRLQFNQDFRLPDAQTLVPYFSRLGITHVYASPLLRSRQTSTHGYDMVDPAMLHPAIGNMMELTTFVTELRKLGLGLLLDIVPNHMAANIENPYWRDVLTYGHSSPFARWFDIDWRLPDPDMWGRVLVPILGAPRSQVLSRDQIRLIWSDGRFLLQYFEHYFPIDPATIPAICAFGWGDLVSCLEREPPALERMNVILEYLTKLPKLVVRLRKRVDVDREETERWLADFARLVVQSPTIERWAEQTADRFTRAEGGVRRLRQLLDSQPYRLVHWREAAQKINYRRFFDINELISIRQEDPQVFEATHTMVLRLFDDGLLDGLRIDHIDGLRDPLGYLKRLSETLAARTRSRQAAPVFVEKILAAGEQLPAGWPAAGTTGYEFLNQVEAVFVSVPGFAELEQQYRRMLRRPIHFHEVAAGGKRRILRNDLAPQVARLADTLLRLLESSRQTVAAPQDVPASAAAPQEGPATESAAIPGGDLPVPAASAGDRPDNASSPAMHPPSLPGLTKRDMVDAIVEVIVALPVYRTYLVSSQTAVGGADRQYVETALQDALRNGRAAPAAIGFLGQVLLLEGAACLVEHERNQRLNFIQRFQQLTGPAAAKGIEDTAFYAYVPLASLNEVGGEPQLPTDDPVAALHQANAQRAAVWPRTMLCVTTHDTKRTADVRARLDVLAELPNLWTGTVARWRRLNQVHRRRVGGKRTPDAGMEYLCYQTMLGLWPAPDPGRPDKTPSGPVLQDLRERIEAYMIKAAREAKTYTSWINEDREYEDALVAFVRSLFLAADNRGSSFLAEVQRLAARVARPGFWNSLSRTLIQFTAPGTPDLYQGDELWNFALVDPDNRRPVDYERRRQLLDDVITGLEAADEPRREFLRNLAAAPEDGRIKLHVIRGALAARRDHARLFASGQYLALTAEGPACKHLVAFARVSEAASGQDAGGVTGDEAVVVVVSRLTASLNAAPAMPPLGDAVWGNTAIVLPEPLRDRAWRCELTREPLTAGPDGSLAAAQVLRLLPVALLVGRK